jgi:Condensation domain
MREHGLERPLGPLEQLYWQTDRWAPRHFVVAAEIGGLVDAESLAAALAGAQRRHPALSAAIRMNDAGLPAFVPGESAPIPLRVCDRPGAPAVLAAIADELRLPFASERAPLVRVVLLRGSRESIVLLVVHHAIADGLSAAMLARELVATLAGVPSAPPLPARAPVEALLGLPADATPALSEDPEGARDHRAGRALSVAWLEEEELARLRSRCATEHTTVHGALSAAFALAASTRRSNDAPLRCLCPVSARRACPGIADDFGLFMVVEKTQHASDAPFWEMARTARGQLNQALSPEPAASRTAFQRVLLARRRTPRRLAESLHALVDYQVVLSNLGNIEPPECPGSHRLNWLQLYLNSEVEPSIGVATVGGRMALTASCYEPVPGLLDEALDRLRHAL